MFKIIGADGKEYGPVTTEQVRQWIAEGRANAQTRVMPEGSTEWRELSTLPEFAESLAAKRGPALPPPSPNIGYGPAPDALSKVQGPAIAIIIASGLSILWSLATLALTMMGKSLQGFSSPEAPEQFQQMMSQYSTGPITIIFTLLSIICCVVAIIGALKMRQLKSYSFAITAAILTVIPCLTVCCCVGTPIGIWALIILMKPEIRAAFD